MKGMLVMVPGQKPSMVRVEQLSYAWSQDYKRREFVKFRHLLANTEQGDRFPVLSKGCEVQVRMKLKIFHHFLHILKTEPSTQRPAAPAEDDL